VLLVHVGRSQWQGPYGGFSDGLNSLVVTGNELIAGTDYGLVWRSSNRGVDWTPIFGASYLEVTSVAVAGANALVGTTTGVYKVPLDDPMSWTPYGLSTLNINSLTVSVAGVFAKTNIGIFRALDDSAHWTKVDFDFRGDSLSSLLFSGSRVLAATRSRGIQVWVDSSGGWAAANNGLTALDVRALARLDTLLFAGTFGGGVCISTNNGSTWTAAGQTLAGTHVWALAVSGPRLFASTKEGVFLSTNNGNDWSPLNGGLSHFYVTMLAASDSDVFGGGYPGVWRLPLSTLFTSVSPVSANIPVGFTLEQNYPNPFNPLTVVGYQLATGSTVKLGVYDQLGREVARLVDGKQEAGHHEVTFDASGLASGVYVYRIMAEGFVRSRTMTLVR
jgi:hypothetical protein